MKYLFIDVGNSRIKWAFSRNHPEAGSPRGDVGQLYGHGSMLHAYFMDRGVKNLLHKHSPQKIMVSNVAGDSVAQAIKKQGREAYYSINIEFILACATACGIKNAYVRPVQLGVDRWLAMIGAYHQTKAAVCVVDCGTATTLDVVDATGQHLGGMILPGFETMQKALFTHTSGIEDACRLPPAVKAQSHELNGLGRNTQQALFYGAKHSLSALIDNLVQRHHCRLFVTGGGAMTMGLTLKKGVTHRPHLVLQGLNILAANEEAEGCQ